MRQRNVVLQAIVCPAIVIGFLAVYTSLRQVIPDVNSAAAEERLSSPFADAEFHMPQHARTNGTSASSLGQGTVRNSKTKILGFADNNYREYAVRWYHRLEALGYDEHVIVATDSNAASYFKEKGIARFERLPYKTCALPKTDKRRYRRELFGRRWKYMVDTLKNGSHVLLTDVDNVFAKYVPMSEFEDSEFDVYHAYSTSYPEDAFYGMGFTVCGGMGWYRAVPKVQNFAGTLLNQCNCFQKVDCKCFCDDQVALNHMLWKSKHKVVWDRPMNATPKALNDWPWLGNSGESSKTRHRVKVWNRTFAYRGPLPSTCYPDTWVAMPLYVDRDVVNDVWDKLCNSTPANNTGTLS